MIGIISPAHILILLQAAASLSQYSIPTNPPPQVIEVTTAEMDEVTCRNHKPSDGEACKGAVGYYHDGDNTIYIDVEWLRSDKAESSEDSTIVHELTHWLQFEHSFGGEYCPRVAAREQESYRVENNYIVEYEHKDKMSVGITVCGYHIGD